MNLFILINLAFDHVKGKLCKNIGHNWRYKDYSNHIKPDGRKYDFIASRKCSRCKQHGYYYASWHDQEKSLLDFESDFISSDKIEINEMTYS